MVATVATGLTLLVPETAPTIVAHTIGPRGRARFIHPAGLLPGFLILTGAWGMAGYFAFLPLYATDLGLDGAGGAFAAYALVVVGLRIVFAKLPDQIGAARLSGAALAVGAAGLAILALVGGPIGLMIGTVVFAMGVAFMFPASSGPPTRKPPAAGARSSHRLRSQGRRRSRATWPGRSPTAINWSAGSARYPSITGPSSS
jgi:hypothetical protein